MSIFDRFKKPKEQEEKKDIKKPQFKVVKKPVVKEEKVKAEKPKTEKPKVTKKVAKKEYSEAYRVIKRPIVTEKSNDLGFLNKYIFEVFDSANKPEVKKAVQDLYGVQVINVNIIKVRGKKRRLGRHEGWRSGYKKALVTLAQGEKIEIISR